jgi:hypothetical protein
MVSRATMRRFENPPGVAPEALTRGVAAVHAAFGDTEWQTTSLRSLVGCVLAAEHVSQEVRDA